MFHGRNIMVIGAHPDDIEYGAFGTLAKYRYGHENTLVCYVMSKGGNRDSSSGEHRIKESRKAMELLKAHQEIYETTTGIDVKEYHEWVWKIETISRKYNINLVLAPTRHDTHQDHRLVNDIVTTALRMSKADLFFYNPMARTLDFRPQLFVDISQWIDVKVSALQKHVSQQHKYYMKESFIRDFHKIYRSIYGIQYCEAFEIGRVIV